MLIERRVEHPLLPLHIVWDRARGGAYASIALAGSGVFGVFLFLTYYMQQNLGFSPLKTGLAFLPMTGMIVRHLHHRADQGAAPHRRQAAGDGGHGARDRRDDPLHASDARTGHTRARSCPGLVLIGLGMGCIFAPAFSTATLGVKRTEAGIASAMVNTSQQVGGSVGTALLSTIFASAAASYASGHASAAGLSNAAALHGYTTAFWWAAGIFALGLLVAAVVLPSDGASRARTVNAEAGGERAVSIEGI